MTNNKQQTAVEWLFDRIKIKADSICCNTENNKTAKGAYVDCLMLIREAQKIEENQALNAYANGQADTLLMLKQKITKMNDISTEFNQLISDNFMDLI